MTVRELSRRYGRWLEKLEKRQQVAKKERERVEVWCGVLRIREARIAEELRVIREELKIEQGDGA